VFVLGQSEVPAERVQQIHRGYKVVETYLTNSKWVASNDRMTLADIAIFSWLETFTQLFTIEEYPKIGAWMHRMRKLPSYEEMKYGARLQADFFRTNLETNKIAASCGRK
jgi:glutathione S-transferase